ALPGEAGALHGQVGEDVDGVADDKEVRALLQAGLLHLIEQAQEQIDIAIDEIEPALVGLAAQAGGDDDDLAVLDLCHVAGADALTADDAGAVQEVEGLALGEL